MYAMAIFKYFVEHEKDGNNDLVCILDLQHYYEKIDPLFSDQLIDWTVDSLCHIAFSHGVLSLTMEW